MSIFFAKFNHDEKTKLGQKNFSVRLNSVLIVKVQFKGVSIHKYKKFCGDYFL